MVTYIILINYTDQGIRNVKDSPKRLDAAKKMLKTMGGEIGFLPDNGKLRSCHRCPSPE